MFSKVVLNSLRKVVDDGYKWGCLPYKWDPSNSCIVITVHGSRTRKYLWYFNIAFYTVYMVYLGGRYLQRQFDESSLEKQIIAEYLLLVYVLPLVIRWCIFLRYEELADFLNSSINFFRGLDPSQEQRQGTNSLCKKTKVTMKAAAQRIVEQNRRYTLDPSNRYAHSIAELKMQYQGKGYGVRWPKEKDSLFSFFLTSAFLIRWLDVVNALIHPELDHLFTSLLPNSGTSTPIWQRALLVIPLVYIWWTTWTILIFLLAYGLAYVRATVLTVIFAKNLSKTNGGCEKPWASFRKIYRSLQLLQGKQNDALGYIVFVPKFILTLEIIRSFALVLAHFEQGNLLVIPVVMGSTSWVYLHFLCKLFGSIHEESQECLREWKGAQGSPRWFRRIFIPSCWSLKICVGGMYFADRELCLTLNSEILTKIVEAALAS